MRIPVYRSQIQATNEAPGRAFQTRKNAQPFVQAALDKGAAGRALTSSIGDYALYRYNMSEQLKLDEASVKVQDELRNLAFDLARDDDPANVLDGSNKWQSQSNQIKKNILASLGTNKNTLQKFNSTFMTSESNNRFALRNDLNQVIKTRKEKISTTYFTQQEELLINNFSVQNYKDIIKEIQDYHAPKVKNKDIEQSVVDGKIREMKTNVAKGVLAKLVGNDPYLASRFSAFNEIIDQGVKAEEILRTISEDEIELVLGPEKLQMYKTQVLEMGEAIQDITGVLLASTGEADINDVKYAFHSLGQLTGDSIQDITFNILKDANDYRQQLREADEENIKKDQFFENEAYEQFFAIKDGQTYDENAVERMLPQATIPRSYGADALRKAFGDKDTLTADELRALMMDVIVTNGTSPERQKTMMDWPPDSSKDGSGGTDSAAQLGRYAELVALIEYPEGQQRPSIQELAQAAASGDLTESQFDKLKNRVIALKNEGLSNVIKIAQKTFGYQEGIAATTGLEEVQRNGYMKVTGELYDWFQDQVDTVGRPSASDIDAKYREVLKVHSQSIILEAKRELAAKIQTFNAVVSLGGANGVNKFPIEVETIADLNAIMNMANTRITQENLDKNARTQAATHKLIIDSQVQFIKDLMQGN